MTAESSGAERAPRTRSLALAALVAIIGLAASLGGAEPAGAHKLEALESGLSARFDAGTFTVANRISLSAVAGDGLEQAARGELQGSDNFRRFSRTRILTRPKARKGRRGGAQGSDTAFRGNLMVAGTYQGLGTFRLKRNGRKAEQLGFFRCPGAQGDVVLSGDYVFYSVDSRGSNDKRRPGCNDTRTNRSANSVEAEGLRIIDISNPRRPRQAGFVETECGSHTQTLVPGRRVSHIYVLSYPLTAGDTECTEANHPEGELSIIRFPNSDPSRAKLLGVRDVLPQTSTSPATVGCHDSGVLAGKDLMAVACLGAFALLDISDPARPRTLGVTENQAIEFDHSAQFTWDGKYMVIGDEHAGAAGGGGCSTDQTSPVGAMWFYKTSEVRGSDLLDPAQPEGLYSLPRVPDVDDPADAEPFRCTTHNFSILPMRERGRYVAVTPYYAGGISVVDFSDPANPRELGWTLPERGTRNPDFWSAYWYRGRIYGNEHQTRHGLSVFGMRGLGKRQVKPLGRTFNPQTQIR